MDNVGRDFRSAAGTVSKAIDSAATVGAKAASDVGKCLGKIERGMRDSSALSACDLLTDLEIEELRILLESGDEVSKVAKERLDGSSLLQGIYAQLSDIGFMHCVRVIDGGIVFVSLDPKARWAVERHDFLARERAERKAEEERRRAEDTRRQFVYILIGWLVGILSTPLGNLIWGLMESVLQSVRPAG